jgi:Reverse transcriptase (RNA-dependent DNA polymerase)
MRGVSVFYKAKLGHISSFKILENSLIINFHNLSIVASYFEPKMTEDKIWNELTETLKYVENQDRAIFAGDYNCRLDKNYEKRETIQDFVEYNDLRIINTAPLKYTYATDDGRNSVVDLILAGEKIKSLKFRVEETFKRKHRVLKYYFTVDNLKSLQTKDNTKSKIDYEKLSLTIENSAREDLRSCIMKGDIENFYGNILHMVDECKVQTPKSNRTSQPWFDSECYLFKRELIFLKEFSEDLQFFYKNSALEKEITNIYTASKKYYRKLCNAKKISAQEKSDEKKIREAEACCHKLLSINSKFNYIANEISYRDWQQNLYHLLNRKGLDTNDSLLFQSLLTDYPKTDNIKYFIEQEVELALQGLKPNKAPGPDTLQNETLKFICSHLLTEITSFFNLCLEKGKFPASWKHSHLKLLFKGKGAPSDMNNFRGISLSCSIYSLLDRIMKNRLFGYLANEIPRNQFGFVKGRSTIQAIKLLTHEINETVYNSQKPLYSLFLDIKKAFDSIDRQFIFQKLIDTKKLKFEELNLLAEMMDLNFLTIWDGVGLSEPIVQSNGVRQGSSLSPLLFIFSLFNINEILKDFPTIKLLIYADDILLLSENLNDIQRFLNRLVTYLSERSLKLNASKCKILKFTKKGKGRPKNSDVLLIENENVEFVSEFTYLGVKFQASGTSFSKHIAKRVKAAVFAFSKINSLSKSSVDTALKLFDLAIAPVASYGIEVIWPFLSLHDLEHLETVKSRFLKKALCLSKFNKSRLVYELADTGSFIEELRLKYSLPETESYIKFINNRLFKISEIDLKFYDTPAMTDPTWKRACFEDRHIFTRFACHGYHYVLCCSALNARKNQKKDYHASARPSCKCSKCGQHMGTYHFSECADNDLSLTEASKSTWK